MWWSNITDYYSIFLIKPEKVRRDDGTPLAVFKSLTMMEEVKGALVHFKDWRILLIAEAIFCCEFPLSIIPAINAAHFNPRTRALNSVCFYAISPPLCILISWMLDWKKFDRRTRGFYTIVFVYIILIVSWGGLFGFLTAKKWTEDLPVGGADWTDDGYGGHWCFLCALGLYTPFIVSSLVVDEVSRLTIHLSEFLVMWIMALCKCSQEKQTGTILRMECSLQ
jgi:hypothetical protein